MAMENQNIGNINTTRIQYVRLMSEGLVENCAREEKLTMKWSLERKLKEIVSVKLRLQTNLKELKTIVQMGEYKKINILKDPDKCIVCLEKERDTVYTECMHLSSCYDCCSEIGDRCSLCRKESGYKRVYIP